MQINALKKQHRSARSILHNKKDRRKKDATVLAEIIYDVFKEKKRKENSIIIDGLNDEQNNTSN
jgi:hypothetical protein